MSAQNENTPPPLDAVIAAQGLTKRYGKAVAVEAISFGI
jgi:hypothetical protein